MSEWSVVISGDWYLPHLVTMLDQYRGSSEQRSCADEAIVQIEAQMAGSGADRTARRLVVIDPEDRQQVERLADAFTAAHNTSGQANTASEHGVRSMHAALREFANPTPPRPEEPTDTKACVTDFRENIWRMLADGDWVSTSGPDIGEYLTWDLLADTRGPLTIEVGP